MNCLGTWGCEEQHDGDSGFLIVHLGQDHAECLQVRAAKRYRSKTAKWGIFSLAKAPGKDWFNNRKPS